METHIADAQTSAPAVAKPDYHTDVTGTGGVGDATNESASNADAQVNATDIGGISGVGTGDEETTNVAQGDEKSRNIPAIHTDVFGDNGTEAVTSDSGDHLSSWKIADVIHEGAEPSDPSGRPNKGREDISDLGKATDRTTGDSGPTSVWTKEETEAAGRSVNPIDKASDASDAHQNSDTWSDTEGPKDYATGDHKAHIMSAFKLADTEIELGLLDASQKYARIAELEKAAPAIVEASLDYANRVKTAGLKKSARVSRRLPSLVKGASTTASQTQEGSDDSALFM